MMRYLKSALPWACCLIMACSTYARAESDEKARERLAVEAKGLFAQVYGAPDPANVQRCSILSIWRVEPIAEDTARQYLGVKVHASLSPTYNNFTPAEIIDPEGRISGAFCDQEEFSRYTNEGLEALKNGKGNGKSLTIDNPTFHIHDTQFTFPVFSDDYQTAIFVVASFGFAWELRSTANGREIERTGGGGQVDAEIWVKEGGVWQRKATERYGDVD